jgi:phage protein D
VSIGYGEPARLKPILKGVVTKIGTSFAESGTPALTIGGFDALHALGIGAESYHWEDIKPSDAVVIVAERNSLPVKITSLDAEKKRIDQSRQSDFAFIVKMAELAEGVFYLRDGVLNFGPERRYAQPVAELGWGEGLSSFSPTANIAKQIGEVQVHGWSAADGKPVVGRARIGDEKGVDSGAESGPQRVGKALGKTPILSISAAVHSQQDADERAKAIFKERGQDLVTGDGECVGLPDLLPDTKVAITGVGRAFSKPYYVTDTTHSLDGKGYRTRFKVKEPSI